MRAHLLFSQDRDEIIMSFDSFDKELIKKGIIEYLTENPTDVVEHCREYSQRDLKKDAGYEILNFYTVNPKNNRVSLIITKGNKDFYKQLEY